MIYIFFNIILITIKTITYNILNDNNINNNNNINFCQKFWSIFKSDYDYINNYVYSLIYLREGQIYSIKLMIYFNSLIISLVSNIFLY